MWMRVMLQLIHSDQIQRAAAIRLMFETASVGALTVQTSFLDSAGQGKSSSSTTTRGNPDANGFGATGAHVEFPQFQSICQTLFPRIPSSETATLYVNCFDYGQQRVSSEVFTKLADERGLFAYALKLPTLPLLKQSIEWQATTEEEGRKGGGHSNAEVAKLAEGGTTVDDSHSRAAAAAVVPKITLSDTLFSSKTEKYVRLKLITLVHRRLASITPTINQMIVTLPERWRMMLEECVESVHVALQESHHRIREQISSQINKTSSTPDEATSKSFIDGIQPYIHYRRLLVMCSLVRSFCDNPLVPTELFSALELKDSVKNIDLAMVKAEKILTNLEHDFLVVPGINRGVASGNMFSNMIARYNSFDAVRNALVARRLQQCFRKFLSRDIPIPRSVRLCMRPGYLGYSTGSAASSSNMAINFSKIYDPTNAAQVDKLPLKQRDVHHDPWWAEALVAEMYRFKLAYDCKAASLGLNPISLAHAVVASQFCMWGSMDLAEMMIHDVFVSIKAYRWGVPRLRLFAAFLGDGKDIDENIQAILKTPQALSVYYSLLIEIHKELRHEQQQNQDQLSVDGLYSKASELKSAGFGKDDLSWDNPDDDDVSDDSGIFSQ
jgi:hypothetical protein